jgi:hypothetical protein
MLGERQNITTTLLSMTCALPALGSKGGCCEVKSKFLFRSYSIGPLTVHVGQIHGESASAQQVKTWDGGDKQFEKRLVHV